MSYLSCESFSSAASRLAIVCLNRFAFALAAGEGGAGSESEDDTSGSPAASLSVSWAAVNLYFSFCLSLSYAYARESTKVQGQLVKKKRNIWSRFGSAVRHRTVEFRLGDQAQRLQRGRISLVCARGDYKTIPRARVLKWVQTGVACAAKSVEPAYNCWNPSSTL